MSDTDKQKAREKAGKVFVDWLMAGDRPTLTIGKDDKDLIELIAAALLSWGEERRKEAMEEAIEETMEHDCRTWSECCDCKGDIASAIRRLGDQK